MSDNLPQVNAAIDALMVRVDEGIARAGTLISLQLQRNAVANASEAKHSPKEPRVPTIGPNRVTGNLVNNIRPIPPMRKGFGTYTTGVESGAVYSRQLEEGGGKWKQGVKYPYMLPARDQLLLSGQVSQILASSIVSALRG